MPNPLRIGINALRLTPHRVDSTEVYLRNLLAALAIIDHHNIYTVFINREIKQDICPVAKNFHVVQSSIAGRFGLLCLLHEQAFLPLQGIQRRLNIFLSVGFSAPVASPARKVTMIDDLQHKFLPAYFNPLKLQIRKLAAWSTIRASHCLLTATKQLKMDLEQTYRVPSTKIRVTPHGAEKVFFNLKGNAGYGEELLAKAQIPGCPYLLAIHPGKNWERLLDAYDRLLQNGLAEHLVITGVQGRRTQRRIERCITKMGLERQVHILGPLLRPVMTTLFKYAEALILPSISESSNILLVEAMAAELPVACPDTPALRETAAEAAIFFNPFSVDEISAAISRILGDTALRSQLTDRGRNRTVGSTWRTTAEKTLAALLETGRS